MDTTISSNYRREVLVKTIEALGEGTKSPSSTVSQKAIDLLEGVLNELKS